MTALVVFVLAAGAACSNGSTPNPSPSATASSSSPRSIADASAITAYNGLWRSMAEAGEVPDPEAPALEQYATGNALARVVSVLVGYQAAGQVTRGRPVTNPQVTAATPADMPTEITLLDCGDSTNWMTLDAKTLEPIKGDERGRREITATAIPVDGTWKISSFDIGEIGSCLRGRADQRPPSS